MVCSPENKIIIKTALFSAVLTLVLFLLVNFFVNRSWNLFVPSTPKTEPFTVQGTGTAKATPDQAQISFIVRKTAPKLEDAQNQANNLTNKIVADLEKIGIENKYIKTGSYNSHPNYASNSPETDAATMPRPIPDSGGSAKIETYTVTENIDITVCTIAKANEVIDVATRDSAENIYGPNLTFSEDARQKLEDEARATAISDAKQKAETLASQTGIRLGKILSVQESGTPFQPQPFLMNSKVEPASDESASTQINPGENTITENITLSFETK
jgi:uncharacterized protein